MVTSLVLSGLFISRVAFTWDGQLTFVLFDDAMISMRYAQNLADGEGLLWNPGGPRVEGYTNFLWTLWMTIPHLLGLPQGLNSLVIMVVGALMIAMTVLIIGRTAEELEPGTGLAAMWATTICYPIAYWILFGMEVGLIIVLLAGCALLVQRIQAKFARSSMLALAGVLALLVLVRDDAVVPAAVVIFATVEVVPLRERRRAASVLAGTTALTMLGHLAFRIGYYGEALPNTFALKVAGWDLLMRLTRGAVSSLYQLSSQLGVTIVLATLGYIVTRSRSTRATYVVPGLVVSLFAYSTAVGGDAWEGLGNRFLLPALPLMFPLAVLGARWLPTLQARRRSALSLAGAGALVVATGLTLVVSIERVDQAIQLHTVGPVSTGPLIVHSACVMIAVAAATWLRSPQMRMVVLTAAIVISTSGVHAHRWITDEAPLTTAFQQWARYGAILRDVTDPDAVIAVSSAGAIPYFAERTAVDILGKSDRRIATATVTDADKPPGHMKWNYDISVGDYRPDIVAQLFGATERDRKNLLDWGYEPLGNGVYVLTVSPWVDVDRLRSLLDELR